MKNKIGAKSKRLIVRPLEARDFKAWVEFWTNMLPTKNEWDLASRISTALTKADFRELLKGQQLKRKQDQFYDLMAFRKSDGKIVGSLALMDISRGVFQNAYLGYSLSNQFWGLGYGKEAVQAILEIAFKQLGLHRVEAGIEPTNRRSIFLAKSLGMRKEGRKVRALFLRNKWVDLIVCSLTCEDCGYKYRGPKPKLRNRP